MPFFTPESMHRFGVPWVTHDGWPGERWTAQTGNGKQGNEIIHHAESCNECSTRDQVDDGRQCVPYGRSERVKYSASPGRPYPREKLQQCLKEVENKIVLDEGNKSGVKKGGTLEWAGWFGDIYPLTKFPLKSTHSMRKLDRVV